MSETLQSAADALRTKQKPLKDKYRSDPTSALVKLSSSSSLEANSSAPLTCSLSSAGAAQKKLAGLHAAAGGEGFDASGELCSGDMLLESLVACFGVTVRAVATSLAIPIDGGSITAEGDLDFRGTMGIKDEDGNAVKVGFQNVRLNVRLEVAEEYKDKAQKLIELSERYCVVLQTLKSGVGVETKLVHVGQVQPGARNESEKVEQDNANSNGTGEPRMRDEQVLSLTEDPEQAAKS